MDQQEYARMINLMANTRYLERMKDMVKYYVDNADEYRDIDPEMTLLFKGMANQINNLLSHAQKRKEALDTAPPPLASDPVIEDMEDVVIEDDVVIETAPATEESPKEPS